MVERFLGALLLVAAGLASVPPGEANSRQGIPAVTVVPPPASPPVPPPVGQRVRPGIAIVERTQMFGYLHSHDYPPDFHFAYLIEGFGFKPGDLVSISVIRIVARPVTVRADQMGAFSIHFYLHWMFCGPRGARHPAPVFVARGNRGSTARRAETEPRCPFLAVENWSVHMPGEGGSGGGGEVTHATPGATAGPTRAVPRHEPSLQPARVLPQMVTMDVAGFGFVPREVVTVGATHLNNFPALPLIHVTADALGRIRFSARAYYLYSSCGPGPTTPQLVARGNRGTRAITYIPMGTLGAPCFRPIPTATPGRLLQRLAREHDAKASGYFAQLEPGCFRTYSP